MTIKRLVDTIEMQLVTNMLAQTMIFTGLLIAFIGAVGVQDLPTKSPPPSNTVQTAETPSDERQLLSDLIDANRAIDGYLPTP